MGLRVLVLNRWGGRAAAVRLRQLRGHQSLWRLGIVPAILLVGYILSLL